MDPEGNCLWLANDWRRRKKKKPLKVEGEKLGNPFVKNEECICEKNKCNKNNQQICGWITDIPNTTISCILKIIKIFLCVLFQQCYLLIVFIIQRKKVINKKKVYNKYINHMESLVCIFFYRKNSIFFYIEKSLINW